MIDPTSLINYENENLFEQNSTKSFSSDNVYRRLRIQLIHDNGVSAVRKASFHSTSHSITPIYIVSLSDVYFCHGTTFMNKFEQRHHFCE